MNLFTVFHQKVIQILNKLQKNGALPNDLSFQKVTVESPKESSFGDFSTNAAMVLAGPSGKKPRELADLIVAELTALPEITTASVAGPGFINFSLNSDIWRDQIKVILKEGLEYGANDLGQSMPVNVEYVSANPTGPMHAGHGRNAVFGDAIAALLEKSGYKVTREYYINDAGSQTEILARSAYLRYLQSLGQIIDESRFEGLYPSDYLIEVGSKLAQEFGKRFADADESLWLEPIRQFTLVAMMQLIQNDLAKIGITMDVYSSEQAIVERGEIEEVLKTLESKGDIYEGVLEKPKGHDVDDWEPRPQTLFRATDYGDDVDRPLKKSNGSWTYFATDIAYHYDKYKRGFKSLIDVLGADHGGYIKRIQAATKAITNGEAAVEVKVCQLVNFLENGQPVKMSKRAGTFIKLSDIVDKVGKDVTRFIMLTRRQDMTIDFDLVKVLEQSKDNPVFYVQYAHARAHSVLRHGQNLFGTLENLEKANIALLTDDNELAVMKLLAQWPRQVEAATLTREPHRITNYLYEVAAIFHGLWNKGKDNVELRFIDPEKQDLTMARFALVKAVAIVLASGLTLFSITPVEEMR
ncbi:arginine--tRNA ligase [Candidatus Paracaedibacter symbiosus]|uniref:arginine--tRNA ligase n=1 Tax=Candidatus Paracaedibacter symbiosus TaxID=244582 RepID=UPI00050966CC|nr:arginine--tRNA ligase [Candidatus Paracaedibacter symbiosus]